MTATPRPRTVFLDVDGTLMQDGRHIPPSAIAAVRAARRNGHRVFLSTGRGMKELEGAVLDIGFDGAVTNGGGFATAGDEVVVARLLTASDVDRVSESFRAHGVHWYLQSFDRLFAGPGLVSLLGEHLARDRDRWRAAGGDPDDPAFFSVGMKTFDDDALMRSDEIAKAVFLSDDADAVAAVLDDLGAEYAVVGGTIPLPTGSSGEVAARGVTKGATILELLAHLGLDPDDAIGIGDNWNDAEMFEVCGTSIAMGNAEPAVQALAHEVTAAIDADGIHLAFDRHGLI
ncbi:Cof-type HAD-IIB family hydrolase [Microbacterium sp.]|uniref:Cof-type HAD-IIB family hydrolase n=1 Tax=Microbacterium sp. TaxID=51671 RepID=UPI003A8388EF